MTIGSRERIVALEQDPKFSILVKSAPFCEDTINQVVAVLSFSL